MQWFIPVLKTQFMLHIHLNTSFIYSVPPNQLGDYPSWLIVFFYHIVLPMLGISAIALKIVLIDPVRIEKNFKEDADIGERTLLYFYYAGHGRSDY